MVFALKPNSIPSPIVVLGDSVPCGTYLLRMHLALDIQIAFGRFKKGKHVSLSSGEYVYVGSAMAQKGSTTLANRLMRHATRTDNQPPQPIRADLITKLKTLDLIPASFTSPNPKKLFWNIDHFLDHPSVNLTQIFMIRSTPPLETTIAEMLENDSHTITFEKGVGANDTRSNTHLLRVKADEAWWANLPKRLIQLQWASDI